MTNSFDFTIRKVDIRAARILVVDDKEDNIQLLKDNLELDGYLHVVSTMDPIQAIRLFTVQEFDLVLLDILMPDLNGYQVMKQFNVIGKRVPVIILTSLQDKQTRLLALQSGARDFLSKPFDSIEVNARVENVLEAHLAQKQLAKYNQNLAQKVRERTCGLQESRLHIIRRLGRAAE